MALPSAGDSTLTRRGYGDDCSVSTRGNVPHRQRTCVCVLMRPRSTTIKEAVMNWTGYGAGGDGYGQQAFAPQGAIGNAIGSAAPGVGTILGSAFGLPMVGGLLGGLASQLSSLLPFGAGPQFGQQYGQQQYGQQQFAPQGAFGNWIHQLAPQLGGSVGGAFGQPQLGGMLGNLAGQLGSMLPFAAGPQFPQQQLAPQGAVGNWIQQLAPGLGGAAGGAFGQQQLGGMLGNLVGQLGSLLPFAAGPQFGQQQYGQQQFVPQGAIGNFLSQLVPQLGGTVGGMFGQPQLGGVLGNLAGQLGSMLPFSAGPQFSPQGAFGNWISQLAPGLGAAAGGAFGQPQVGGFLGNLAGQLGSMLPFSAAPQYGQYGQSNSGYGTRPQIAN